MSANQPKHQHIPEPWELHLEAPELVPNDPSQSIAELGPDDILVSKTAQDAGRRAVLRYAGDELTADHQFPSEMPDGVAPSLAGKHVFVKAGNDVMTIPVTVNPDQPPSDR